MKNLLTGLFLLLTLCCFSQTDHNGNPVFNSIPMGEDSLNGLRLLANYYTLQNNIDNKGSSVYISDRPTTDEIARAATNLPADFYVLLKDGTVIKMILINYYPRKRFFVITPGTPASKSYTNPLKGDIAENRANELVKAGYDPAAMIQGGKLSFDNKHYTITPNDATKRAVIALIKTEHLDVADSTAPATKMLSKDELRAKILAETKEGGKLDFFTPIKGKEMEGIQVKPGIFDTRIGIALYNWGKANYNLGVGTVDEALAIFAEFRGRPVKFRETEYIKLGFEKGLER
jgi:hypothetical protein